MRVKIRATIEYEEEVELAEVLCDNRFDDCLEQLNQYGSAKVANVEVVNLEKEKKDTRKAGTVRGSRRRVSR